MPVQLIEFKKTPTEDDKDNSTIHINKENLDKVLKLCGDRPLCIICICGPSRQGKSFILGHMIRCFDSLEQGVDDWMDWGNPKKPLEKGFTFQNAYGPVTQGIWMWEKPFIMKNSEGRECAVLLIDTQGTYDEFTSNKDMTAIVGLSLLMSSVMIFNFFTSLQEDILGSLGTYIEYGLIALDDESGEKPFQKLKFLIRDWNNPTEFEYGKKGGAAFIKKKLEIKENQPESAKKVRKTIEKCFQEMSCFLMPAIGDKALAKEYDGNIAGLNKKFAINMEKFINDLSDKELVIKRIVGNEVTAKDLVTYMDSYVETFNASTIPSAMSMWEATTLVANNNLLEKAKKVYQDKMSKTKRGQYLNPEAFAEAQQDAMDEALEFFRKGKKYGDDIKRFETSLTEFIENEARALQAENEGKRMNAIKAAQEEAKNIFHDEFEVQFEIDGENTFWEEIQITREAGKAKYTALDEFRDQLTQETSEETQRLANELENIFDGIAKQTALSSALNQKNATDKIEKMMEGLLENYKKAMKDIVEKGNCEDPENLSKIGEGEISDSLEEFDNEEKPGTAEFHQGFRQKLEMTLKSEWDNIEMQFKLKLNEQTNAAEEQVSKLVKEYKEFLEQATKDTLITKETENQLNEQHQDWIDDFVEKFQDECRFSESSTHASKLVEKLKEQLDACLEQNITKVREFQKTVGRQLEDAVKSAAKWYEAEMKHKTKEFLDDDQLDTEHNELMNKALDRLKEDENAEKSPELEEYLEKLEDSITTTYQQIKLDNERLGEMNFSKAKNEVHNSLTSFKATMSSVIEGLRFEDGKAASIEKDFQEARNQATDMLLEKCANLDQSKKQELVDDLNSLMDKAYQDQRKMIELKELEMKSAIRDVLDSARRYYHGEMSKSVDQNVYLEPGKLDEIHKKTLNSALNQHGRDLKAEHKNQLQAGLEQSYIKYREENNMRYNSEASDIAIGIDLGTTYCCVAAYFKGQVRILKNSLGTNLTPSYVNLSDDGETIGELAKKSAFKDPENTIYDAKRMIGRKWADEKLQHDIKFWPFKVVEEDGVPKIQASGKTLYPEQISAKLLKHLRNEAEKELQRDIKKVVITVPAYFTDGQRQATVDAGDIAGFEVLEILNEPTAAAIAYKVQKINDDAKKVLIYDLGGGTFDVALLEMKVDEIKVLSVDGDTHLGGEDFDKSVMEYCANEFKSSTSVNLFDGKDSDNKPIRDKARAGIRRLQSYSEDRKKDLAQSNQTEVVVDNIKNGEDLSVKITRDTFEKLNNGLFEKTLEIVDRALADAGLTKRDIDDVVLVGGSTRIPKVQSMLSRHFGGKRLNHTIHPDEAVAYGAAVRAAMLNGASANSNFKGTKVLDITPMSLGVEVASGDLSVIIKKGSPVPSVHQNDDYTTVYDNQTTADIRIFQGEERIAKNNELLGEFRLEGIPAARKRTEFMTVKMEIDKMGVLKVTASSKGSGSQNALTVKADKSRLSEEDKRRLREEEQESRDSYKGSNNDDDYDGYKNYDDDTTDDDEDPWNNY